MPLLFQLLNVEIELVFFFNRKSNLGEYMSTPFCLIKILAGFHMEATKAIKNWPCWKDMFNLVIYPVLRILNFMMSEIFAVKSGWIF